MGLRILFDVNHNPVQPTIILANRNGNKLGVIDNYYNLRLVDVFTDNPQMSFKITKESNGKQTNLWQDIVDFKLVWCKEWDFWFQIKVDLDDGNDVIKSIDCTPLCQAELSQLELYNIQINTETDIARSDYQPTVIYNQDNASASTLDRITEKAPHYSISHVDSTIANIQRTFEFNGQSIKDGLDKIATEIGCLIAYNNGSIDDPNGILGRVPARSFSLYDLESNCNACGYRGEFTGVCPECHSTNITSGYGNDTTIFVTKDNLTEDVTFSTDVDSVKNCFHVVGGDDMMNDTIKNCNPDGSAYIWYITDDFKRDMTSALANKLDEYNESYSYYNNEYVCNVESQRIESYNDLIDKYSSFNESLERMPETFVGYSSLMNGIYNAIDFELWLDSVMMPTVSVSGTNAAEQAGYLTSQKLSPCAVSNYSRISLATADKNILSIAKILVRSTYKVEVKTSSYDSSTHTWTGNFVVTNYSDETDTAESDSISVLITDNYEKFVKQKINKILKDKETKDYDITELFKKTITVNDNVYFGGFVEELKKYGLKSLTVFHECCQSCIDILVEQGISDLKTWGNKNPNLYNVFYVDYMNRLRAIDAEMACRESEIKVVKKLAKKLESERKTIQTALDFKTYLGETNWKEFCSYRRDGEYSNSNYVSDGLTNGELFKNARELLDKARKELYKSATLQHQITSTLKNLLLIPEFEKILNYFEVGNWIRIEVDGKIYKLRLTQYEIDFDNLSTLNVEFSDVLQIYDGRTDVQSILSKASSMSTSYNAVERQATKGEKSFNKIDDWGKEGLATTLTKIVNNADHQDMKWDSHGMLFRKFDDVTEQYQDEQLKIVNSTIAVTDDNWETTKTAVGKFYYYDPKTQEVKTGYGVNGEVVVGKMIIGENLSLKNDRNTLGFDENGFIVTNSVNAFIVNPNADKLLEVLKYGEVVEGSNEEPINEDLLYIDTNGNLVISGTIYSTNGNIGGWDINDSSIFKSIRNSEAATPYNLYTGIDSSKGRFVSYIKTDVVNNQQTVNTANIGQTIIANLNQNTIPNICVETSTQTRDSNGNVLSADGYSITGNEFYRFELDYVNNTVTYIYKEYERLYGAVKSISKDYRRLALNSYYKGLRVDITKGCGIYLDDGSGMILNTGTGNLEVIGGIKVPDRSANDNSVFAANTKYVKSEAERIVDAKFKFIDVQVSLSSDTNPSPVTIASNTTESISLWLGSNGLLSSGTIPDGYVIKSAWWNYASFYSYLLPTAIYVSNSYNVNLRVRNVDTSSRVLSYVNLTLLCVPQ